MKARHLLVIIAIASVPLTVRAQTATVGDASRGAVTFKARCATCHTVSEKDGAMAPSLRGVFGKEAASRSKSFSYSPKLRGSGKVWTSATLDAWLRSPQAVVPGSKMYMSLPSAQDRLDVIAYLKAQK